MTGLLGSSFFKAEKTTHQSKLLRCHTFLNDHKEAVKTCKKCFFVFSFFAVYKMLTTNYCLIEQLLVDPKFHFEVRDSQLFFAQSGEFYR
jgi:hypothetical protein